ncbi:MAG: dicarboxylate/amino acid:cation symporter [Phycisphaerales bacterium]|nr:dicarboxylate/amino acid:cation symporter [Phycisphaerales bacterium]
MRGHKLLNTLIFIGLIAGVIVGWLLYRHYGSLNLDSKELAARVQWLFDAGDLILIRPLKMLIIPLVFTSVVVGITSIGDPSRLGLIGSSTLVYYFATMLLAAVLGVTLVTAFQPGEGVSQKVNLQEVEQRYAESDDSPRKVIEGSPRDLGSVWMNILRQMIPDNVLSAAVNVQPLPVITFSILFGLALGFLGESVKPATEFFEALFRAVMQLVGWVLWLTPIGVFLLVSWTIARLGGEAVAAVGKYMLIVFVGLVIHGFLTLPVVLLLFGKINPYRFMWRMRPALVTAFGTDSSSATLPVTIRTAENEGECSKKASGFVLPLGSTINMDGTALYEAVAVIFLFQVYGIELGFEAVAVVALTATLAAVGAAGIPSAGLVTMVIVIEAVNTTLAGTSHPALPLAAVGLIFGVDRILDMCRTTINVWGDAVGAKIITRIAPDEVERKQTALG